MNNVIERCIYHQHQHHREADAKAHFLRPFRQRAPANTLDQIEQKVSAIEERNGKQIQQADRNRNRGGHVDHQQEADVCGLADGAPHDVEALVARARTL